MMDEFTLPPDRPMPDLLKESMWNRLAPELHGRRSRKRVRPVAVAAAVGALALSLALVFAPVDTKTPEMALVPAGAAPGPADVQRVKDCVAVTLALGIPLPDPGSWRPTVKVDENELRGFLVIRNEKNAAVCVLDSGRGGGLMTNDIDEALGKQGGYASLTAERPLRNFTGVNGPGSPTYLFGIVTDEVAKVSVITTDNAVVPAVVHDGTFVVKFVDGNFSRYVRGFRVTMNDGRVLDIPGM